ncbi:Leukocyte elastase inhibitor [Armadillidium nasatum]|uniref:Leukocyte elastase inhibitor n=1 Tax=Armadillidium nasatum TaxID=96803 RepID=A0A5N5TFC7_9CRUS|nr:Leukocyte elastase inhibitor [Armadillidium nasatum]
MDKGVEIISSSVNSFAKDLYQIISKSSEGNVFFSPFSIATALSMLHMGSKGNTELQIMKGMHLPEDKKLIKKAFHEIISDYKRNDVPYELRTSNMAYVQEKFTVTEEFLHSLQKYFLSIIKNVDFSESEKVTKEINEAVEKETNSKIRTLSLQICIKYALDELTRLVLVNAIYFKGNWIDKFNEKFTKPKKFWISATQSLEVPMMYQESSFRLNRNLGSLKASLLALDYEGSRMSFVILLPDARDGLSDLEEKLASVDLGELDKDAYSTKVKLYLPKFKMEESVNLNDVLMSLGMTDMFGSECDLSGFSPVPDLYVSDVLHKAFLEVNEEGCEAAAATGVCIQVMCYIPPVDIVIDHPFLFYIQDNRTKQVLFVGRCVQPTET